MRQNPTLDYLQQSRKAVLLYDDIMATNMKSHKRESYGDESERSVVFMSLGWGER